MFCNAANVANAVLIFVDLTEQVALLLMNNANSPQDVSVEWTELPAGTLHCPTTGCTVRDIHNHVDLHPSSTGFVAKGLVSHDSAFILVSE